ncbi:MAG: hypothetical protein JJ850_09810 [Kordiimonadaceae bacterium]|nr:hypothetical protein [Kordiimonadaceae bacterium]MBO6569427.1 hypothetical protein [Kordiimonadaceae bacterium]MBO6964902.1 hypothetical protein [Kordiimonadaceae bacterium]
MKVGAMSDGVESSDVTAQRTWSPRSIMAGCALVTSGVIIALMVRQYLTTSSMDDALIRSRLWWEVVLNIQLLSAGIIWFAHSDAISRTEGKRKRIYILQCLFSVLSVLLPSILALISAVNNWFEVRPSPSIYWMFIGLGFLHWAWGFGFVMARRWKLDASSPNKRKLLRPGEFAPFVVLLIIIAIDAPAGGNTWTIATPILLFMQGAMPYFYRGFGWRR